LRISLQLRPGAHIQRFLWLALFAAGLAMAPVRIAAAQNQPAPASAPQTHGEKVAAGQAAPSETSGLPAQPGHEKDEEAEEHNLFRHTALVQKMANLFHLDVETTARLFEIINSVIILLAIFIPIARILPKVIRKRSITMSHNLAEARKTTEDANARLTEVEAQLSRLDEEIAKIRAQVEDESKQDEARIKATIEEEHARIVAAAEQEISSAAAQAQRGLRHFAADLAIERAVKELVLTPETDRALIEEFISQAHNESNGSNGAARGGKN